MLELPISPATLVREVITPGWAAFPVGMASPAAVCLAVAICVQESNLADRRQGPDSKPGPARGLAQFERAGVAGVLNHPATDDLARMVCALHKLPASASVVHKAMESNDILCLQFTRLNLLWDKAPLPAPTLSNRDKAFAYYVRTWRPGAASTPEGYAKCAERWRRSWQIGMQAVA